MQAGRLQSVVDWLIDGAQSAPQVGSFVTESCERIVASGIPIWRVGVFVSTLHPTMSGRGFIWRAESGVSMTAASYGVEESDDYLSSPIAIVYDTGHEGRRRLRDTDDVGNSSFLASMQAEGVTDYFALPITFSDGQREALSWSTRREGGFTDTDLDELRAIHAPLSRMIEIFLLRRTAAGLLDNYVGPRAGQRILAGQIRRGHTETMRAVIWLSDLRGFTPLSDRLPPDAIVELLNQYFDCQVAPILDHGGEILKFMGDGLLAVFPVAEDGSDMWAVCQAVLQAARASRANVASLEYAIGDERLGAFRFGLALHVGQVLYGNIGGGDRLDFTCIGPAVNLAARLEKIAGALNRTVVASTTFVEACSDGWTDLGEFPIAGLRRAEHVYGLIDETLMEQS
ncbi:MAG: adenylate/guanylate cyclase domain-containing protein [Rhizobiales bacterium]|nr:adenylate/guanylate cyclase domain-containing protein [Hyphomicrobiales bacterium]